MSTIEQAIDILREYRTAPAVDLINAIQILANQASGLTSAQKQHTYDLLCSVIWHRPYFSLPSDENNPGLLADRLKSAFIFPEINHRCHIIAIQRFLSQSNA